MAAPTADFNVVAEAGAFEGSMSLFKSPGLPKSAGFNPLFGKRQAPGFKGRSEKFRPSHGTFLCRAQAVEKLRFAPACQGPVKDAGWGVVGKRGEHSGGIGNQSAWHFSFKLLKSRLRMRRGAVLPASHRPITGVQNR